MKNEIVSDSFISDLLKKSGIDFTPNGSNIKEIQDALKTASKKGTDNAGYPEFTAKSKEFILIIEKKASLDFQSNYEDREKTILATDINSITNYAENGALHYARQIISKTSFKKIFAFGCSGDEKHHIIRPIYVDENGYKLLEIIDGFQNFSSENIDKYYKEQILGEVPKEILETQELIKKTAELHEALRNYGQLGDKEKPLVVSAILLALQEENFKIDNLIGNNFQTDGSKIYSAIETYFDRVKVGPQVKKGKVLHQFNLVRDRETLNQIDERLKNKNKVNELAKTPLRYFTEFIQNNILPSIKADIKEDVLGRFYGEFMHYSGGDGQTLGVVLTPYHITELFCDLIGLKHTDKVFDPCCGTAGFLVAAMHYMEKQVNNENDKKNIKLNQLHGIEIREDMFSIATTNMILRNDGKSNLINDNFLNQKVDELKKNEYDVGFMNPPYSQAKGNDTAHLSEIHFIEHLLDSLKDGGRAVVIVPQSTMVGKTKNDIQTKKDILKKHTLEGVITLNNNTFYSIGVNPCIAVFTAHKPHDENKYCKFINFQDDGFVVRKHIGLVETERAKERKGRLLNCWINDAPAETKFMVKSKIEPEDEWLHSFYFFNDEIPSEADFEKTISEYLTFEFNMIMQGRKYLFENNEDDKYQEEQKKLGQYQIKLYNHIEKLIASEKKIELLKEKKWKQFTIAEIFDVYTGSLLQKNELRHGKIPRISATDNNNGISGFYQKINNKKYRELNNFISITFLGSVFYHPYTASLDMKIHAIKIPNKNLYRGLAEFLVLCIKKSIQLSSYGNQLSSTWHTYLKKNMKN